MDSQQVYTLLKYLEGKVHDIPINIYIIIWAVTDMYRRIQNNYTNPNFIEIKYPFSRVSLFTLEEAHNLEERWRETMNNTIFPNSLASYKSIFDQNVTEAKLGIITLESTNTEAIKYISTIPVVFTPAKTVAPIISTFLEVLRIVYNNTEDNDTRNNILIIISTCIHIASGNNYRVIFTTLGFIHENPTYLGCMLKILMDTILMLSPSLRIYIKDSLSKSPLDFISGFSIWLFTIMEPQFMKENIAKLLKTNTENIPNVSDLYLLRDNIVQIYSISENFTIIEELRDVPPYNVFLKIQNTQNIIQQDKILIIKRNKTLKSQKH